MGFGYLLMIVIALGSLIVQWRFKSKFKKYSEMPLASEMSGHDVAETMLTDNEINDVCVISAKGQLSDHYNPANKTINLSPDVYHGRGVAAAAIASHEVGHVLQHARVYGWLQFRSAIVPAVNVATKLVQWTLMIGVLLLMFSGNALVLLVGVVALAIVTFFSFIALPVEFDASKKALAWLYTNKRIMQTNEEYFQAKDALWWAAMTYVVAALGSLATLLYYASIFLNRKN